MAEDFAAVTGRQPQAIRTALAVLHAVAQARGPITAGQLSVALGLPPATTYRIVNVLVRDEYLARLPGGRGFGLGARAADLVAAAGGHCSHYAAGGHNGHDAGGSHNGHSTVGGHSAASGHCGHHSHCAHCAADTSRGAELATR